MYENEVTFDAKNGDMVYSVKVWYETAFDKYLYTYSKIGEEDFGKFNIA